MRVYLMLWCLGIFAGAMAAAWVLRRRDALSGWTIAALIVAIAGLLIGAKWHGRLEEFPILQALAIPTGGFSDPGYRLPLGILTGGIFAGMFCLAVRAPWRAVGDALAVGACVMIAVGRLGCLYVGCCVGGVCSAWLPWCHSYVPHSLTFLEQVDREVITTAAHASLPAHPLPLYFMAGALLLLAVLLTMLRRGAPPGTLLLVFALAHPATKLFIESFRFMPREPWLMVGVPATQLAIGVIGATAWGLRRLWRPATVAARAGS